MIPYQKTYTAEEVEAAIAWIEARMNQLPESLHLTQGIDIPNLRQTVNSYFKIARKHRDNPTYGGQVHHLFVIQERLIEEGL